MWRNRQFIQRIRQQSKVGGGGGGRGGQNMKNGGVCNIGGLHKIRG